MDGGGVRGGWSYFLVDDESEPSLFHFIFTRYPFPLEWAKDKLTMGSEKKGKVFDAQTLRNTAYHEAGHTLVAYFTEVREMSFQQLNRLTDRPTNRQTD